MLDHGKCFEHQPEWEAREADASFCDHELSPLAVGSTCSSLGECGAPSPYQRGANCWSSFPTPTIKAIYIREDCDCARPPSPPSLPPPSPPPDPSLPPQPPAAPPPPFPLPPGEQLGTLNVTVTERFITLTLDVDERAIDERLQDYTNTLAQVVGEVLALQALITVRAGAKVFANTTSLQTSRRSLQSETYQAGADCEDGYTPVTTTITLLEAVPQTQIKELVRSLPNSVLNQQDDAVFICGATIVDFEDEVPRRIAAPPPPPRSTEGDLLWPVFFALLGVFLLACCACAVYGIWLGRGGDSDDNKYDEYGYKKPLAAPPKQTAPARPPPPSPPPRRPRPPPSRRTQPTPRRGRDDFEYFGLDNAQVLFANLGDRLAGSGRVQVQDETGPN
tara:strand:+ start:140 stop:1312 length:1173 start_codon:yes stop_codon:yes gene_type:complete